MVELRNHYVEQSAALLAAPFNHDGVGGRDKNQRNQTDMLRQPLILFLVALEMFLGATFHPAIHRLVVTHVILIDALQHEEVLSVGNHLRVDGIAGAAAKREIIHSIQHIRLALSVVPYEAIHLGRQLESCRLNVLIIDNRNLL